MNAPVRRPAAPDHLAGTIFDDVRRLSADGRGVSRPAFSDVETRTLDYLATVAARFGLDVTEDPGRNLVFSLPRDRGAERWALVGSHVDSVPDGGNFDGLAGVVAGLLVLINAQETGQPLRTPLKCIALRAEEGAWFGSCYLGSRALTGQLGPAELEARHRADGRPLADHMGALGIATDRVRAGEPLCDLARITEFLELHIEQGPLLLERGLPAAIVTGIRGNLRYRAVRCIGEAGHSGAVPRSHRHDPVMAMAELMTELDRIWAGVDRAGGDLVVTSGMVATDPSCHALTRIADEVTFSLDVRSQDAATLDRMRRDLAAALARIAAARGVRFETGAEIPAAPALMDAGVMAGLMDAMVAVGATPFAMPSGAGHDAAVFANAGIPAGMVFIRSRNGSHNPAEAMGLDDLLVGAEILSRYFGRPPCGPEPAGTASIGR